MPYEPRYFKPEEIIGLNEELVAKLDIIRHECGFPLYISSGFRPGDDGEHGKGNAVDIKTPDSWQRWKIVTAAIKHGIERIGIYNLHTHVGIDKTFPTPRIWWDTSK